MPKVCQCVKILVIFSQPSFFALNCTLALNSPIKVSSSASFDLIVGDLRDRVIRLHLCSAKMQVDYVVVKVILFASGLENDHGLVFALGTSIITL